ncbi:MAG: hypothetical protein WCD18_01590 [Thermosynechococcaceae cyanobacterium]
MKMHKIGFNLLSGIAITGLALFAAFIFPSLAQTPPEQPAKMMPGKEMTPEQMRQQHQQMMGKMMERMGKMEQMMSQMTPEQMRQHHQQMMTHMQEMMQNMDRMMDQTKGGMGQGSGMPNSSIHHPNPGMSMPTPK